MAVKVPIICPHDRSQLSLDEPLLYRCPVCLRAYPVEDGVLRLLDGNDGFYEGAYENQVKFLPRSEHPWHVWPLWLIDNGYPWLVRRHVPQGGTIIELGCAGGVRYFGQRYHIIGCDLSFSSLRKLRDIYECRIQADATVCIPLPDASVDAVISSYFWEHVSPTMKPTILSECQRILRPGGKLIFLYDVETENPLIRRYKERDSSLYRKLFIEGDGHLGYQTPHENLRLFREAGFNILVQNGMEKTWLQSSSVYAKLAMYGGIKGKLYQWLRGLMKRSLGFYLYTALLRTVDTFVCPLLPADWARIEIVVCEKKTG